MRHSFRTHRLCAIPGVSPRAGLRCPVGAHRTPQHPRAFLPRPNHHAAAGSGRSEHRNVDILIPLARQRESSTGPNVPCERRTDPAEPPTANKPQAPAPALGHCKTGESTRGYAAFLQNAPVVRHTRGFTPGWYAVPRWGTPNASAPPSPHFPQCHHHNTPGRRRLFFLNGDNLTTP
jgi:hypothetical protein